MKEFHDKKQLVGKKVKVTYGSLKNEIFTVKSIYNASTVQAQNEKGINALLSINAIEEVNENE